MTQQQEPFLGKMARGSFDPRGEIHIPLGNVDEIDTLKSYVEPEGCFSPGIASYGVYFWLYDANSGKLTAPTQDGIPLRYGLTPEGYLIPWSEWSADSCTVRSELCQVKRPTVAGEMYLVGARVTITNGEQGARQVRLYAALRPMGPAGWPVHQLSVSPEMDALLVEGHPAVVADQPAAAAGVSALDDISAYAEKGQMPAEKVQTSSTGDCSGALCFDLDLAAGVSRTIALVCPVLPGRRAVGHQWNQNTWFKLELNRPNPLEGGRLQPDPGLSFFRGVAVGELFAESRAYWEKVVGPARMQTPDPRWAEATTAIACHMGLFLNEGAPDLAVYNLSVFNRDCTYMTNFLQKSGHMDLARMYIQHMLRVPFSGRVAPEADNPGQLLWLLGEHWKMTRDTAWLKGVYPIIQRVTELIRYYRTTPGPHWVWDDSYDFGEALPEHKRKELKPGACDGFHPEYTEAFDIAGLRSAAAMAEQLGQMEEAASWRALADELFAIYEEKFSTDLGRQYGSFAVQWPCRLYPLREGKAFEQFKNNGMRHTGEWRYFPLATAHQGLLSGNREAGCGTIDSHLAEKQMVGWYTFDEGGPSGSGGWGYLRTTWSCTMERPNWASNSALAMPDGWSLAEVWLLMRDSLYFEDEEQLVLLAGIDPRWLEEGSGIRVDELPTHFGLFSMQLTPGANRTCLTLSGTARPPRGYRLRLPEGWSVEVDGQPVEKDAHGDLVASAETREVILLRKA